MQDYYIHDEDSDDGRAIDSRYVSSDMWVMQCMRELDASHVMHGLTAVPHVLTFCTFVTTAMRSDTDGEDDEDGCRQGREVSFEQEMQLERKSRVPWVGPASAAAGTG